MELQTRTRDTVPQASRQNARGDAVALEGGMGALTSNPQYPESGIPKIKAVNKEEELSESKLNMQHGYPVLQSDGDSNVPVHNEEQSPRILFRGPRQMQSGALWASGSDQLPLSPDISGSARRAVHSKSTENDHTPQSKDFQTKRNSAPLATFRRIFGYADALDYLLMILGTIGGIGEGLIQPMSYLITAGLIDEFGSRDSETDPELFQREVHKFALFYVYLALSGLGSGLLEITCWMLTSDRQVARLRSMYIRAILRQDDAFFDTSGANSAEVVNSVGDDTLAIQDALGEKMGHFISSMGHFVGGITIAFYLVWKLILITLPFAALLIIPSVFFGRILARESSRMHDSNMETATIAEHTISAVRTVYSFVGEQKTLRGFAQSLEASLKLGIKVGIWKGFAMGAHGLTFAIWGFMTWYGGKLVASASSTGGKVICAGLAFTYGAIALGQALPNLTYFMEGYAAAKRILAMIDRIPIINLENMSGEVLPKLKGNLEFRDVFFVYPSRPDSTILCGFSLIVPAGLTVALVGESGSGKSTVISILERFYDPLKGQVLIDDIDIRRLQLKWLRTQIGLVSQEPALFATTIKENILLGKEGATFEEVVAAAKAASIHTFIDGLPNAYNTNVGEHGVQMSGGQKQRIAIARAILKNPPILLLDEATSALDAESERTVQISLDSASLGRTTLMVAHRLSTIQNADLIAVVRSGQVVELGPHLELVDNEGSAYSELVKLHGSKVDERKEKSLGHDNLVVEALRSSGLAVRRSLSTSSSVFPQEDSDHVAEVMEDESDKQKTVPPSFIRLLKMSIPEWRQALLGSIGAVAFGLIQPTYAFILARTAPVYFLENDEKLMTEVNLFALVFVGLGIGTCISSLMQHYYFAEMGEHLSKRVRESMLEKVLTFEIGWFDNDENSSSAVCSKISSEANVVQSIVADRISLIVQTAAAIIFAWIFGLLLTWRLALVMITTTPITIACYYARTSLLAKTYNATRRAQEAGCQVASEAVSHHRTIAAFASQDKIIGIFESVQAGPRAESRWRAIIGGIGLGSALCAVYCTWALYFWWGAELVYRGQLTYDRLLQCFFVIIATAKLIANAGSMTSDLARGANSVKSVFDIIDRRTKINPDKEEDLKLEHIEGNIELRSVHFRYPARPEVVIFRNFNLRVSQGKHLAMVGQSGSGKSTIISLIERFYDPQEGQVLIDGYDLRRLHLRTIRTHIALVSQEPTLFAGTIRENILYGKDGATEVEIVEAAKAANAYTFISSLKDGFQTSTGERGLQLSGGQKQRIAIARAILKSPRILLLDEATSALDAQSEKTVQDALDRIMVGTTSVVVAHRLSTIQNCDSIAVLQDGSILEQGTHEELLQKGERGAYAALFRLQREV